MLCRPFYAKPALTQQDSSDVVNDAVYDETERGNIAVVSCLRLYIFFSNASSCFQRRCNFFKAKVTYLLTCSWGRNSQTSHDGMRPWAPLGVTAPKLSNLTRRLCWATHRYTGASLVCR